MPTVGTTIMDIQLTLIDNGDLTATVILTGLEGSNATLYLYQAPTLFAALTPTMAGSFVGDGVATLSGLQKGLYTAFAILDDNVTFSPVASVLVTNGEAVATRCRDAVSNTILAMSIVDYSGAPLNVYRQWCDDLTNVLLPCLILDVEDGVENDDPAVSTLDDIGYPVNCTLADDTTKFEHQNLWWYERTRENIARAFRRQRLFGVVESKICLIEFGLISNSELLKSYKVASSWTVRCVCREGRGIGI